MKRSVLGFLLFFAVFAFLFGCENRTQTAEGLGTITFELYDSSGSMVASKEATFHEGDTLLGLLKATFTVYCQDEDGSISTACDYMGPYGTYIRGIEDVHAFDNSGYIAFYINGSYAMTGIDTTPIVDGNVYQFKYETINS